MFLGVNVRFSGAIVGDINVLIFTAEFRVDAKHPAYKDPMQEVIKE
jgi:hypothetical protein